MNSDDYRVYVVRTWAALLLAVGLACMFPAEIASGLAFMPLAMARKLVWVEVGGVKKLFVNAGALVVTNADGDHTKCCCCLNCDPETTYDEYQVVITGMAGGPGGCCTGFNATWGFPLTPAQRKNCGRGITIAVCFSTDMTLTFGPGAVGLFVPGTLGNFVWQTANAAPYDCAFEDFSLSPVSGADCSVVGSTALLSKVV